MLPFAAPPRFACFRSALLAFALGVATLPVAAPAAPILWPATPDGLPEWRDERDTAPFLAAWKAEALRRQGTLSVTATANQAAWDARWYDLDLTMNPVAQLVSGTVKLRATVVNGPVSTAELDLLANMTVDAATSGGVATTFTHPSDLLTVNLDRAYAAGETFEITVTYHGLPATTGPFGGAFGFTTANSRTLIWSLSEPYGARSWWPCKDAPEDKADSVTVRYTVPTGMTAVSNGNLRSATDNGTNAIFRYGESYPIATYLVFIGCYAYTHTRDWYRYAPTDSMPIDFYNYPESVAGVSAVQAKVKGMIAAYSARMGQYPFVAEKYGHAQFNFSGGMEHQTCTSLGAFTESVVAHELGHQWWGDMVTCRNFHHIWLNEGFATYMEALWAEAGGGHAAYQSDLELNTFYGAGSVYVPDTTNQARIFDSNLSYNKGSWVLHMLRHVVSDTLFFQGLNFYRSQMQYQGAVTEDLQAAMEQVSGRDLSAFFQEWVYGEYYPIYRPRWTAVSTGSGYDVTLTIDQTQSWQLFNMPIDVRVATTGGDVDFVVPDSLASQVFVLHVASQPTDVTLDPGHWILRKLDLPVVNPAFDRSVLVVNGVDWSNYGTEITTAYVDKAFSGNYAIDFWDHFPAPAGGYPANVPAPLGHGAVPPSVLGHYRNVIWVGNNFNGDLDSWVQTPILSYVKAGGNVLLLSRMGDSFLTDSLLDYAGITFVGSGVTLTDCVAARPGLVNMSLLATQTLCATFDSTRTRPDTQLLFRSAAGANAGRGLGVVRIPPAGAGLRARGGRLAFVSGRPYRWNHAQLASNVTQILTSYFGEPVTLASVDAPAAGRALALSAPEPNPFGRSTSLRFTLRAPARVDADVIDLSGRRVRVLAERAFDAGAHVLAWDGRDASSRDVPAGVYWVRVRAAGVSEVRRLVHLP